MVGRCGCPHRTAAIKADPPKRPALRARGAPSCVTPGNAPPTAGGTHTRQRSSHLARVTRFQRGALLRQCIRKPLGVFGGSGAKFSFSMVQARARRGAAAARQGTTAQVGEEACCGFGGRAEGNRAAHGASRNTRRPAAAAHSSVWARPVANKRAAGGGRKVVVYGVWRRTCCSARTHGAGGPGGVSTHRNLSRGN